VRVVQDQPAVTVSPGTPSRVELTVTNTLEVIDGIVPSVQCPPGLTATVSPALLPLFPDSEGRVVVDLEVTPTFPAGHHELEVQLRSSATGGPADRQWIPVLVPPVPGATLSVEPVVRSTRHRAAFTVVCDNTGNTPLELVLAASDPDHLCLVRFSSATLAVAPGATGSTAMTVSHRRRLLGNERSIDLVVAGNDGDLGVETHAVLRHRPLLPRGVRTALVLGAIVAAWAAVLLLGLTHALAGDPLTKQLPASFYLSRPDANHAKLDALGGIDLNLASADSSAPNDAVPKAGVVIGVGGTVAGTVTAASTGVGVGRIRVVAYQGSTEVASAATQSDGSYAIVGLLPGPYRIEFTAAGFRTEWNGGARTEAAARPVEVAALATTGGVDAVVDGLPATIEGQVLTGDPRPLRVQVTVTPQEGAATRPVAVVTSSPSGAYTIPDLPAPQVYDLAFSAPGFEAASDSEEVTGGQTLIANTVTLTAQDGEISGTVTSSGRPLGGVSVTAIANGQTFTTATPTSGAVGSFTLSQLPSPATYLLRFSSPGYGTVTVGENLGPGQLLAGVSVALSGGAGTISGVVTSAAGGQPIPGATVTADSGTGSTSVQTINSTGGQSGQYDLSGLGTPGDYTLTFSATGYITKTISVSLGSGGVARNVDVALAPSYGSISGRVLAGGSGVAGVAVSITDGTTVSSTVSASDPAGYYVFSDLPPGTYTLTFSLTGQPTVSYVQTIRAGQDATGVDVNLGKGA
jgi:hypothetical protein